MNAITPHSFQYSSNLIDSGEQKFESFLNFLSKLKWYSENPKRVTKICYQKMIDNQETSLAKLTETWFWKTISVDQFFNDLEPYRDAMGQLIKIVLSQYCPHYVGILEVGAGYFPIANDLSEISDKIRNQIHISDISPKVIAYHKKNNPAAKVMELDSTQLTRSILPETYHCIIMRDVLSVLTKDAIDKSLREFAAVLKPGGTFIHMQNREPFDSPIIDSYSSKNVIIFHEIIHSSEIIATIMEGIYIVDKTEFMRRMNALRDDDPDKKALSVYVKMYPAEREEFCNLMLYRDGGKEVLKYLIKCLKKLSCSLIRKISLNEAFTANVINSLEQAGFEVLKNETMYSEVIVERKTVHTRRPHSHLFRIDKGVRTENYLGILALGMIQEKTGAHVIIAKKSFEK